MKKRIYGKVIYCAYFLSLCNFSMTLVRFTSNRPDPPMKKKLGFNDGFGLYEIIGIILFIIFTYLHVRWIKWEKENNVKN